MPSWIQCGVAAAGQCPGAPTIPTTGGARARRVGCMSGPDNGARRATAREASCMHLCVAWQLSDFSAGWWGTRCCKVPEAMATTSIVLYIIRRLCKRYGAGQATSRGLSTSTGASHHRLPRNRFAFFASGFSRASHAMSIDEHSLEVSEPSLR